MRFTLGLFLILSGIVLGVYVGFWLCFIGGIMDIINQVRAPEVSVLAVMLGVLKICFSSFCGTVAVCFGIVPGVVILQDA